MYIKRLEISGINGVIRKIEFRLGLNLIVDDSNKTKDTQTGNNVGKTTVLRLIDFCLGGKAKSIYKGNENASELYQDVADFLVGEQVAVTLTLLYDWEDNENIIALTRKFCDKELRTKNVINGTVYNEEEYKQKIRELIYPELVEKRPTLREIISHNIRYDEMRLESTLKTLHSTASLDEYDVLNLFLFNSDSSYAGRKIKVKRDLEIQTGFQRGLKDKYNQKDLKEKINNIDEEIKKTQMLIDTLIVDLEDDDIVQKINRMRKQRTNCIALISSLDFKIRTINETITAYRKDVFSENISDLTSLYSEVSSIFSNISIKFEQLVDFHNRMSEEKIKFISEDLKKYVYLKSQKELELKDIDMELTSLENSALRQKSRVNDGEVSCLSLSRR